MLFILKFYLNYRRLHGKYGANIDYLPVGVVAGTHDFLYWDKIPKVFSKSGVLTHKDDFIRVKGCVENVSGLEHTTAGFFGETYTHSEYGLSLRMEDGNILICEGIDNNQTLLRAKKARDNQESVEVGGLIKDGHGGRLKEEDLSKGYLQVIYFRHGDYVFGSNTVLKKSPLGRNARLTLDEAILLTSSSPSA